MKYRISLRFSIALFLFSVLAQILSWQYFRELRLISFVGIGIAYSGIFIQKEKKGFFDFAKVAIVIIWVLINILIEMNYVDIFLFRKIARGLLMAFVFLLLTTERNNNPLVSLSFPKQNAFSKGLLIGSIVIIGIGSMFKYLSFPNANGFLIVGFCLAISLLIVNVFNQKKG
jgi:hypothetical protein